MIVDVILRERFAGQDLMGIVLSSPVVKNIFLALPDYKKYEFVRNLLTLTANDELFLS